MVLAQYFSLNSKPLLQKLVSASSRTRRVVKNRQIDFCRLLEWDRMREINDAFPGDTSPWSSVGQCASPPRVGADTAREVDAAAASASSGSPMPMDSSWRRAAGASAPYRGRHTSAQISPDQAGPLERGA